MTIKPNKTKVEIKLTFDLEYTEEFETQKSYDSEIEGLKEELTTITNDLAQQIYSVKLTNQKTKISFV